MEITKEFSLIKFIKEHKESSSEENIHQDFIKLVAMMKSVHMQLLDYINSKERVNYSEFQKLFTYGLLVSEQHIHVFGIHIEKYDRKHEWNFELVNNGMFPIHFTNGEDDNNIKYDTLVSFILLASQRAYEEAKLITRLKSDQKKKNSITRLTSVNEGDTLIGRTYDKNGNNVDINIIIKEHCHYLSDKVKDIFIGQIEHNNVEVYVKLFKNIEINGNTWINSAVYSQLFLYINVYVRIRNN